MSSSGEKDQAVHGSGTPPAAAAQTVAVPRTGLGKCRLRGAQCACAAPAVAVPPVLMLKLPLKLLSRRRSPRRGLSISPPAPTTGAEGAGKAHSKPSLPEPLQPFPSRFASPPLWCGWLRAAGLSPTSARRCARWPLLSPRRSRLTLAVQWGPGEGEEVGRGRQDARGQWAVGGGHISVSPAKVPSPNCSRERGCRGGGVDRLPLQPALRAERGLTGRRAGTQSSHLTLLPPPSGLGRPKLNRGALLTRPGPRHEPEPDKVRAQSWGRRNGPCTPG